MVKGRGRAKRRGSSSWRQRFIPKSPHSKDHRIARSLGPTPRNLPIKGQRTPCPRELQETCDYTPQTCSQGGGGGGAKHRRECVSTRTCTHHRHTPAHTPHRYPQTHATRKQAHSSYLLKIYPKLFTSSPLIKTHRDSQIYRQLKRAQETSRILASHTELPTDDTPTPGYTHSHTHTK